MHILTKLSSEFSVKIVELEDIMKVSVLRGHEGGVRRVTWHPFTSLVVRLQPYAFSLPHLTNDLIRQHVGQMAKLWSGMFQEMSRGSNPPLKASFLPFPIQSKPPTHTTMKTSW